MKRRAVIAAASFAAIGGVASIPATSGAVNAKARAKVDVVDFEFVPDKVKIHKGDKVTWRFREGTHNVTGKGWKSRTKSDGRYSHVFDEVGTYRYRCTLHQPDMDGVVKVVK